MSFNDGYSSGVSFSNAYYVFYYKLSVATRKAGYTPDMNKSLTGLLKV